mmetsp:Transcript_28519/g.51533  ORF Transcript_28519/g.51533 Transcript_28519/m.51533 type:complete len:301 (+) Transcript_28519:160-1062(+)|eukprot:CAMPEP_0201876876 /NCGR_PEP_ID=MMETSP0902-20130614/8435_1 /ASSEMBLY_ACC=CAM_ASM_000551 /TAXON_ID=420261 /ORGANISM="Thalassiosira antarctica, Strain CCMP982" /LENGTH=300 /DNA_ID=CAMNT_0048404209 /DNA_START=117 /DNA_END=1019 /DNA_ORIENTATION=+
MAAKKMNHYEVLEISKDAKLIDIKKAYRRLALKHHPDRNGGSEESTEKFKEISAAYTILSDTVRRRGYDVTYDVKPKSPSTSVSPTTTSSRSSPTPTTPSRQPPSPSRQQPSPSRQQPSPSRSTATPLAERDPFEQFDDLFQNDPFFHDGFQNMDDTFAQRFDNSHDQKRDDTNTSDDHSSWESVGPLLFCGMERPGKQRQKTDNTPWSEWLMNKLGIELSVTSISHKPDGSVVASAYTSKPFGTYSKKKSRMYVENGQQVSVMSMEKDGNRIEDKFIGGEMVERKVNGKIEEIPKLVAS